MTTETSGKPSRSKPAMKLEPEIEADCRMSRTFGVNPELQSTQQKGYMTNRAPKEKVKSALEEKVKMIKKEPSDPTVPQTDRSVSQSKPWQPTGASLFTPASLSPGHRPTLLRSEEISYTLTPSASPQFRPTGMPSVTQQPSTSSPMVESFSRSLVASCSPQDTSRLIKKRKSNPPLGEGFLQEEPYGGTSTKRMWGSVREQTQERLLEERAREWKEKQAMWQSMRTVPRQPVLNFPPRFGLPPDQAPVSLYNYELGRYAVLSSDPFYYSKGTRQLETSGPSSRLDVSASSASRSGLNQREDTKTSVAGDSLEPVIKDVVSLAERQLPSETVTSVELRRTKRPRKNYDESLNESSESATSDNDGESPSAGKYISDLVQPYTNIPDDHQVAHINGLLSLPSNRETRYGITYGELKRRCNSPESLTRVDLVAYVRHSKSSGRNLLDKYKIVSANRTSRPTVLSKMCENEARVLGDGILKMNVDYFPGKELAQAAATRLAEGVTKPRAAQKKEEGDELKNRISEKLREVEITRSMLKEIYDLLLSEKDVEEMKRFELASHTFGTANLMNHLTLFDRFFEDYRTSLTSMKT